MAEVDKPSLNESCDFSDASSRSYGLALQALSTLITKRKRGTAWNGGDVFALMDRYVQILDLEEALQRTSVIHVAGTKGKGSTCTFSERILRSSGLRTGLFTSPHLIDVRERFRFDGEEVSEEIFEKHFWWCWDRFQEAKSDDLPLPAYFRFLTLLGMRMFTQEGVDVMILEVGLGGRFDATNVVKRPAVCGIASLGFDHMEILGNTLPEIAFEKAGILKPGVPAFTCPQREDALEVLQRRAAELSTPLEIAPPLETYERGEPLRLGLAGAHQRVNAALAVALCRKWAEREGRKDLVRAFDEASREGRLPATYTAALAETRWSGRAQIVRDKDSANVNVAADATTPTSSGGEVIVSAESSSPLTFFLDGAHTPESIEVCAQWFSDAVGGGADTSEVPCRRVLVFNCMEERDPHKLLPPLINALNNRGLPFHRALFVPGVSAFNVVNPAMPSLSSFPSATAADLRWQFSTRAAWDSIQPLRSAPFAAGQQPPAACETGSSLAKEGGGGAEDSAVVEMPSIDFIAGPEAKVRSVGGGEGESAVMPSLPATLDYLRRCVRERPPLRLQVLVTGSLHLVGDVLRLLKH